MIRITSDSTCDLGHLVEERGIVLLPLTVNLGEQAFHDGVDITPDEIPEEFKSDEWWRKRGL